MRVALGIVTLAVSALVLSSCATGPDTAAGSASDMTTIRIGMPPVATLAPVMVGVEKGFFEQEGVRVDIVDGVSAPTIFPSVVQGNLEAGGASWAALTIAVGQGLPLVGVSATDRNGRNAQTDTVRILAPASSGIKSMKDLAGRSVAVNQVKGLSEIQVMRAVEAAGLPRTSVKYVPVPFANMPAALSSGQVDAVSAAEPFATQITESTPVNLLAGASVSFLPDYQSAAVSMSAAFAKSKPDAVAAFQRGMARAATYAQDNRNEVRQIVMKYGKIDPALAAKMQLPEVYEAQVDVAQVQKAAELLREYGVIRETPNMSEHILPVPSS